MKMLHVRNVIRCEGLRRLLHYTEEDMAHAMWIPLELWQKREEHNVLVGTEELEALLSIANAQRRSSEHVKDQTPITREQLTADILPDVP